MRSLLAASLLIVALGPSGGLAQEPETQEKTPLQIEAEEAKLAKEIATAKLDAAKAEKELEELDLPEADFAPEQAGLTVKDEGGYYGELLSFVTLEAAAREFIGSSVFDGLKEGTRIVVTSDYEFTKAGTLLHLAKTKLGELDGEYQKSFETLPSPPGSPEILSTSPFTVAASGLSAASELAAFLRVQRELSGRDVEASSDSLVALVVKHLRERKLQPMLPQLVAQVDKSELTESLESVRARQKDATERKKRSKERVKAKPIEVDLDKATQEIAELTKQLKDKPDDPTLQARLARVRLYKTWWDEQSAALERVDEAFGKLMARLETVPEKSTHAPIEILYAHEALIQKGTHVLLAQAVSQGADVETSSGALRRTKISFVGGSACLFYLADAKGTVLAADLIPTVASRSFTGRIGTDGPRRVSSSPGD